MPRNAPPRRKLSDEAIEAIASRFKVFGEPMRLKILCSLEHAERNVTEICRTSGATQANASRHLQLLVDRGILRRRKEGLNVFYAIEDQSIFALCADVCRSLELAHEKRGRALMDGGGI